MRALVVNESMYGNTHLVAEAVGRGLRAHAKVSVVPVERADRAAVQAADLVVVGGPTHGHGMSRASTREAAVEAAQKPDSSLHLDADAEGEGLREWFDALGPGGSGVAAAAFDTRFDLPAAVTGRASKGIHRRLRHHGFTEVAAPESFFVVKGNTLEPGEEERAVRWGEHLAAHVAAAEPAS
jgi:flavodoxin